MQENKSSEMMYHMSSIMDYISTFIRRQPLKTIFGISIVWVVLAFFNYMLNKMSFDTGAPFWFPISIFSGPTIHIDGLLYILLFAVTICVSLRSISKLSIYHVWLIGIVLIVLANLGQGNFYAAFVAPFQESGIQYYHDAVKITSWREWLGHFNNNQSSLLAHSKIHPPGAVLVHYLFLQISGNNIVALSVAFIFISSLAIPILWYFLKFVDVPVKNRNIFAILFSVIPAVNIYSAVSLDGVIMAVASLFLLGIIVVIRKPHNLTAGILLCMIGSGLTNLLTYAGIFLFAVGGLLAFREVLFRKTVRMMVTMGACLLSLLLIIIFMKHAFNYNHIQGFMTASKIENPYGFRGLAEPLVYLMTRIECVSEIGLFLSFGCIATLLNKTSLEISPSDLDNDVVAITIVGVSSLVMMFLSGAFNSGETARSCLFIYPYLIILLFKVKEAILKDLVLLAGIQTAVMQLMGNYFW